MLKFYNFYLLTFFFFVRNKGKIKIPDGKTAHTPTLVVLKSHPVGRNPRFLSRRKTFRDSLYEDFNRKV